MNFAFYISGNSNRLYGFLKQVDSSIIKEIKLIVSEYEIPDTLTTIFKKNQIDYVVFEYDKLEGTSNKEKNLVLSNLIMEYFDRYSIDYGISFGSHLLAGELLDKYRFRLINFHPAILPMYPGSKAIDQAVEHGNTLLVGNTAHFIDSGMDTGIIIMQSVIPLKHYFDNGNDYDCILDLQIDMLNQLIKVINEKRLSVRDGKAVIEGADYGKGVIFPVI